MTRQHLLRFLRFAAFVAMVPMQNGCAIVTMFGGHRGAPPPPSQTGETPAAATAAPGADDPQTPPAPTEFGLGSQAAPPASASAAPAVPRGPGTGPSNGAAQTAKLPDLAKKTSPPPAKPPNINAPGAAGSNPPTARLPPPANTNDRCNALCKKFGIRSIGGSNATLEELDKLDRVFSQLPTGLYMNLAVDYEPTSAKADERAQPRVAAYWTLAREDGSKLPDKFLAPDSKGGRMFLFRTNSTEWTICHETCHHISMQA